MGFYSIFKPKNNKGTNDSLVAREFQTNIYLSCFLNVQNTTLSLIRPA